MRTSREIYRIEERNLSPPKGQTPGTADSDCRVPSAKEAGQHWIRYHVPGKSLASRGRATKKGSLANSIGLKNPGLLFRVGNYWRTNLDSPQPKLYHDLGSTHKLMVISASSPLGVVNKAKYVSGQDISYTAPDKAVY